MLCKVTMNQFCLAQERWQSSLKTKRWLFNKPYLKWAIVWMVLQTIVSQEEWHPVIITPWSWSYCYSLFLFDDSDFPTLHLFIQVMVNSGHAPCQFSTDFPMFGWVCSNRSGAKRANLSWRSLMRHLGMCVVSDWRHVIIMVMFSGLPCLSWKWKSSEKGDDYVYGITPNELLQVDTKWM